LAASAVENVHFRLIITNAGFWVSGLLSFLTGLYLLWTYRTAREWRDLFWLGCYCLCTFTLGVFALALSSGIVSSLVWFSIGQRLNIALALITLAEFSAAAFRVRSQTWRWFIWPMLPLAGFFGAAPVLPAALCLFWAMRQLAGNTDTNIRVTAGLVAAYACIRINYYVAFAGGTSLIPLDFVLGPFRLSTLAITSSLIAIALMFVTLQRLLQDKTEKQRLARELEAARAVQTLLLSPQQRPLGEFEIGAIYSPAQEVGGDFYHVIEDDGAAVVVVGDVSGKGLKAAMLVALLIGALRQMEERRPSAILQALNRALAGQIDGGFVTCCCLRVEPEGMASVANAGHPAPYCSGAEVDTVSGLPLGLVTGISYEETRFALRRGEQLCLLSDGVPEAANARGELFGFDRTREISAKPAAAIAETAQAWGQNDDITVVTVRRRG
jgi:hypothetical protein